MDNNQQYISEMAQALLLPPDLTDSLLAFIKKDMRSVNDLYQQNWDQAELSEMAKEVVREKGSDGYLALLAFALLRARKTKECYLQKGIPEAVFWDTMGDIKIWCENCRIKNHAPGLENVKWLNHHFQFCLFRLGRLQFQMWNMKYPAYVDEKVRQTLDLQDGDPVLNIHIPQGESLKPEKCKQSLARANQFFSKYFPDFHYKYAVCESWLLFSQNQKFMHPESNISKFAEEFTIIGNDPSPKQAIERLWGWDALNMAVDDYAGNTTLQKSAKAYLKCGGTLGMGFGIIDLYPNGHHTI